MNDTTKKNGMVFCCSCKKLGFDLKKLVSNRYICEKCIETQCSKELNEIEVFELNNQTQSITVDMSVREFILKSSEHYKQNDAFRHQNDTKNNLGINLFNIKTEINLFDSKLANYESVIKSKLDVVRFEVNQVYEFNLKKLNTINTYYTNLVNNYEFELFHKLKKTTIHNLNANAVGLSNLSFNFFDSHSKASTDKSHKLFDKSYMLNELKKELEIVKLGSYFGSLDDTLQKIKRIEAKLSSYELVVNSYMDEFYSSVQSNKFMDLNESLVKSAANKLLKKYLNIGCLKFESHSSIENKTVHRQEESVWVGVDKQSVLPLSFEIVSIHSILDAEKNSENLIIYYKSENKLNDTYKLDIYDNDGDLIKKAFISGKHVFALNSNKEHLVICYADKIENENSDIKLAVFDFDLKLICSKSVEILVNLKKGENDEKENRTPVDVFVDSECFYLLLVNFELKKSAVFAFNLTIDILNFFHLEKNQFLRRNRKEDLNYLRVIHANRKLFIKQKSLYGTRLDIVDSMTGAYVDKLTLDYNFDYFFIDSNAKYLNFMRDGKIYNYDLAKRKMLNVSYLDNHQKWMGEFCVSNKNTFNAIFTI